MTLEGMMAFLASNFGMTVTFMDGGGNTTTREYEMNSSILTFDDADTAAIAMLIDLGLATDAAIPRYRVFQNNDEATLTLPATTVQIENCASLTLLIAASGSKKANLNLPAPKNTLFVSTSPGPQNNIVNLAATPIVNFVAKFLVTGDFTVSDGETVSRSLNGHRVHKKSNKG